MNEMELLRHRKQLMRSIERKAGLAIFSKDPYVKFLPLILNPVDLDWSFAGKCEPTSERRLIVIAYGRDPIAYEGWLRFAIVAAYSALLCKGVDSWAVDLLVGPPPTQYTDLAAKELFGGTIQTLLESLNYYGITVKHTRVLFSPGDAYKIYDNSISFLLRIDADAGLLPGAMEKCFSFNMKVGYSGLNARHNNRNAMEQLIHPAEGRMKQWPIGMRTSLREWVNSVVRIGKLVLRVDVGYDIVLSRMKEIPWPSEGLSYIRGEIIDTFLSLRDELVSSNVVPSWDEESVKLAMLALLGIKSEYSQIPVLEHWEYGSQTSNAAIVNFRNQRSIGPLVKSILKSENQIHPELNYVQNFLADLQMRVKARRCVC